MTLSLFYDKIYINKKKQSILLYDVAYQFALIQFSQKTVKAKQFNNLKLV